MESKGLHRSYDQLVALIAMTFSEQFRYGQKVPTNHKTKSFVYPFASKANESTADRKGSAHLGDTVVHHCQDYTLDRKSKEQATRSTMIKTGANTHEEGSSNGAPNCDELNLPIPKVTLEVIGIISHDALLNIMRTLGLQAKSAQDTRSGPFILMRESHSLR
jgi:hypothetical protein